MKFATVFAVLATVATAVSATFSSIPQDTNAKRFALGLKPLPPVRRDPSPSYGMRMFYPIIHCIKHELVGKVLQKASLRANLQANLQASQTLATPDLSNAVSFSSPILLAIAC